MTAPLLVPARRRVGAGAGVRVAVGVGGLVVVLAAPHPYPVAVLVLAFCVGLAVVSPERTGAGPALAASAVTFLAGAPHDVGTRPVLLAAAGMYLVHTATALAAACPWTARLAPAVLGRWVWRCLPAAVLTAVAAAVDATLGTVPSSWAFVVVALALAVLGVGLLVPMLSGSREPVGPSVPRPRR